MNPSEELAPLPPAPCNSNCSMPPHGNLVDAGAYMPVQGDSPFNSSSLQEDWMDFMNDCMSFDDMMHGDAADESFIDLWGDLLGITSEIHEDTSSLVCRSMSAAHFSSETPETNMADGLTAFSQAPSPGFIDLWGNLQDTRSETSGTNMADASNAFIQPDLPVYSEATSFAVGQHNSPSPYINIHVDEILGINPRMHTMSTESMCATPSPALISGSTSGTYFTDTSYLHPSPMPSEASSFAAPHPHEPFYMSNYVDYYHDWRMRMHPDPTNSICTSIMPDFVDGRCSAGAASILAISNNDGFEDEATSFAAFASFPRHEQNLASNWFQNNLEMRAGQPHPNSEAGVQPLHAASDIFVHRSVCA